MADPDHEDKKDGGLDLVGDPVVSDPDAVKPRKSFEGLRPRWARISGKIINLTRDPSLDRLRKRCERLGGRALEPDRIGHAGLQTEFRLELLPGDGALLPEGLARRLDVELVLETFEELQLLLASLSVASSVSGAGTFAWDGKTASGDLVPSGVYFARVVTEGGQVAIRKIVRVR